MNLDPIVPETVIAPVAGRALEAKRSDNIHGRGIFVKNGEFAVGHAESKQYPTLKDAIDTGEKAVLVRDGGVYALPFEGELVAKWPMVCYDEHREGVKIDVRYDGTILLQHGDHKFRLHNRIEPSAIQANIDAFAKRCHDYDEDEFER